MVRASLRVSRAGRHYRRGKPPQKPGSASENGGPTHTNPQPPSVLPSNISPYPPSKHVPDRLQHEPSGTDRGHRGRLLRDLLDGIFKYMVLFSFLMALVRKSEDNFSLAQWHLFFAITLLYIALADSEYGEPNELSEDLDGMILAYETLC